MVDMAGLRALVRETNFGTLGQAATVTVPDGAPVETRIIWLTPDQAPSPAGARLRRVESKRVMAIRSDDVPDPKIGTVIAVTEPLKETPALWTVDATDSVYSDHRRVVVVPRAEPT